VGPEGADDRVGNTVTYRDGQVWDRLHPHGAQGPAQDHLRAKAADPYRLKEPDPPVAVLTSHFTGSSAEFVALAFRGRPRTRSFGGPTAGGTSGNEPQVLPDGAMLYLTVCLGADREGETYDGPILPDEAVAQDWAELGTARDGVLQAALAWLGRQPRGG
ncbi:MAG TPA: S41 family peptidase, partial [Chloroflexota bacterium]|nr:S41 family peptidase [Chloroflexota bacterium]